MNYSIRRVLPISRFQTDIWNELQITLELEIDISNAVIGLSNTDISNKRVLPQLIYLRERERERQRQRQRQTLK